MSGQASGLPPLTAPGQRRVLTQVVQFSRSLHAAGLPVNPANLIDLCRCMRHIDLRRRDDFRAAARATLVSGQADLPVFDLVFDEFWSLHEPPERPVRKKDADQEEKESSRTEDIETPKLMLVPDDGDGETPQTGQDPLAWSRADSLSKKDFKHMSDDELHKARRLIAALIALLANVPSRRLAPSHTRGPLDLRRMLRANALHATDGLELRYRKRRISRTRLLLLCDVSGSMERYSRFLIQFIYALRQQMHRIDVAVFATRLTVITDLLGRQDIEQSLQQVGEEVRDWGGGTDIGQCLQAFNDRFADRLNDSHATAIVLSDGWDRGDPHLMRMEMQRLNRSVRRLLWLNPLLGHDEYQPLCQGMRTALPFIDEFLPAHNLNSLAALLHRLRAGQTGLLPH